jgi:hypothetical protein
MPRPKQIRSVNKDDDNEGKDDEENKVGTDSHSVSYDSDFGSLQTSANRRA